MQYQTLARRVLFINNPINITKITYKFGIIPAILNHVKKLACRKYIKKNINIKEIIIIVFFILYFFLSSWL